MEQKIQAATGPESDAGFMLMGLPAPGKEHEPLAKVTAALTGLLMIVDGSEAGPAADAGAASARWEEAAQEALARWAAFQRDDLASVNALLEKAKLKTLVISPMVSGDAPATR